MKKQKRLLALTALLLVVAIIVGNNLLNRPLKYDPKPTAGYQTVFARPSEAGDMLSEAGLRQVGESEGLKLYYDPVLQEIELHNTASGFVWKSACRADSLRQLCNVTLINTESDNTLGVNNFEAECVTETYVIDNGVALKMFFPVQGVGLELDIWLENGRLWVLVPIESLTETDLFSVLSIDILPYFGASASGEQGYILYPDGSGALYDFSQKTVATSPVTVDVYSDRVTDVDGLLNDSKTGVHSIRLPAYGINRGTDSLVAFIADGSTSASVTLEPAGYVCDINRIYSSGIYRKVTEVVSEAGISSFQSDGRIGMGDYSVCYQFMSGENSDYSAMADKVRSLMNEYKLLPDNNTAMSLKLDVVMGAEEETMVGTAYRTVTTLSQLSEMFKKLDGFENKISAVLVGWQKQGYGLYPDTGAAASSIGSLKKFEAPKNVDMYLDYHAVLADKGRKGAVLRRDGIRNSKRVTILGEESGTYIVNANTQLDRFNKLLPKLGLSGKYGLSVAGAGSILYDDYNAHCGMTRQQTANSLSALLDNAGKSGKLMVDEPNAYALKYADFVSKLYQNASGYHILGETVPFYEMVLSGCVPYSLDVAGNLSSDFRVTRLRWAEYGAVPYFVVSADGSSALSNTAADVFFAVDFEDQLELINVTVEEFDALQKATASSRLCRHVRLADNVYCSEYENGTRVFINYNSDEVTVQGITVAAMDYTVKEGA